MYPIIGQAQDIRNNPNLQQRLTQAKLTEIKNDLGLSEAKMKELSPIYKQYSTEIYEVHFSRQVRNLRVNPDSLSAEEADKLIESQLDNAVKLSTIRRKFYPEFKKVLTPQQIIKLYKAEANLNKKVMQELRRRNRNGVGN